MIHSFTLEIRISNSVTKIEAYLSITQINSLHKAYIYMVQKLMQTNVKKQKAIFARNSKFFIKIKIYSIYNKSVYVHAYYKNVNA